MAYRLRMRNTEAPKHGDWATFVKSRRTAARMSAAELSRRLGIDPSTLWRWETGKQKPDTLEMVAAFADIFAVDLDDALTAARLRPAEVAPRPEIPLDPDVQRLVQIFEDPQTSAETKAQIRTTMRALLDLAESQPRAPRRRKAG